MTGIPIINVNNNCSTGSTALYLAKEAVESGKYDCVLALGFEKMERGSLSMKVISTLLSCQNLRIFIVLIFLKLI